MNGHTATTLDFDPLLPFWVLAVLALVYAALFTVLALRGKRHLWLRALVTIGIFIVLLNPVSVIETRKGEKNDVLVLLDETQSQSIPSRPAQLEMARRYAQEQIGRLENMKLNILRLTHNSATTNDSAFQETHLFGALRDALQNTDPSRLAAVIVVTDGQIHDMPKGSSDRASTPKATPSMSAQDLITAAGLPEGVPVHVLLTGSEDEADRQIIIEDTPFYGITGQKAAIKLRVQVDGAIPMTQVPLTLKINGAVTETRLVTPNRSVTLDVDIAAAGHNVYELSIPSDPAEMTALNNTKIVKINGVRDRLQVLLVSGKPNPGGRMWRDILRSDAGVDLVHFTILREPGKVDMTPEDELSLIEFPIRELFETKIQHFDLIVLDRYGLTYLLPTRYFDNMHDFVANGGALLIAAGPEAVSDYSIFDTSLKPLLPAEPTGRVIEDAFLPELSRLGRRHPVTSFMAGTLAVPTKSGVPSSGKDMTTSTALSVAPWFRQIELTPAPDAQVLLQGVKQSPLLMLKRYEKGRVALLGSDQLWLWARGFDKGGPDRELLKRLIHWLMKEPDLEENGLQIDVQGQMMTLTKRSMREDNVSLIMRRPSGREETILITPKAGQAAQMTLQADETGIYSFKDQDTVVYAVIGDLNTPEQIDLISTFDKIAPLARATGGFIDRIGSGRFPDIRVRPGVSDAMSGRGWMALCDRQSYSITGTRESPLIPTVPAFILLFIGLVLAWVSESQRGKRS